MCCYVTWVLMLSFHSRHLSKDVFLESSLTLQNVFDKYIFKCDGHRVIANCKCSTNSQMILCKHRSSKTLLHHFSTYLRLFKMIHESHTFSKKCLHFKTTSCSRVSIWINSHHQEPLKHSCCLKISTNKSERRKMWWQQQQQLNGSWSVAHFNVPLPCCSA